MEKPRDASIDSLLRAAYTGTDSPVTPDCLDAETLGAWMADRLGASHRARAEAHVAGCARCQSLLAVMARAEEAVETAAAERPRSWFRRVLPWAAPLTAAATAAVVWLAVRPAGLQPGSFDRRSPAPVGPSQSSAATAAPAAPPASVSRELAASPSRPEPQATTADTGQRTEPGRAPSLEKQVARAEVRELRDREADERTLNKIRDELEEKRLTDLPSATALPGSRAVPTAPPVPPVAPAAAPAVAAPFESKREAVLSRIDPAAGAARQEQVLVAPVGIASPDPKVLWRILEGRIVLHSGDGGSTWAPQSTPTDTTAFFTAGAAPSATVCWIVGRGGVILLTTDGRTWRRLTFPEPVDLVAIRAASAEEATVTAADGRTFSTKDGGRTWGPSIP